MSGGYFTARQRPDGQVIVLAPDGLTYETQPGDLPTTEAAQAYALALNEWLDHKPDPRLVSPFFNPDVRVEPDGNEIIAAIDRLFAAEDRLDLLSEAITRGHDSNPQEVTNG